MKNRYAVFAALLILVVPMASGHDYPQAWPHAGDMWYDGSQYVDTYFEWHYAPIPLCPQAVSTEERALEMNVALDYGYASSCDSGSDLPQPFDGCPTAGVSDPAGTTVFEFGSFEPEAVQENVSYFGWWNLYGVYPYEYTGVNFNYQELENNCAFDPDDIWCLGSIRTYRLFLDDWTQGTEFFREWQESPTRPTDHNCVY